MPIAVTCGSCNGSFRARDDAAGKRFKCPGCGNPVVVPEAESSEFVALDEAAPPPAPIPPAPATPGAPAVDAPSPAPTPPAPKPLVDRMKTALFGDDKRPLLPQRLKVLVVLHQFLPKHVAGTEIYAHRLAREIRDRWRCVCRHASML